jgi:hypothetical protein
MPRARAKGERVTISAPLVPIVQAIQVEEHCADLTETVNWIIRDWLKQCRGKVNPPAGGRSPIPSVSNSSPDLDSILKELS